MQETHIETPKTARYFTLGNLSEKTKNVWIVCHGYGQLANYFLKKFEVLENDETVIIAPEGLHRFYWEKFTGKVVASWMTKEDRENDIKDYVRFLDTVLENVIKQCNGKLPKITVLGFSQGTATVCRWILQGKIKPNHLILWAGAFPHDINFEVKQEQFSNFKTWLVLGDEDPFMEYIKIEEYKTLLEKNKFDYEFISFKGKHDIDSGTLQLLIEN